MEETLKGEDVEVTVSDMADGRVFMKLSVRGGVRYLALTKAEFRELVEKLEELVGVWGSSG
jgi:hypothetical protein